MRWPAHECSAFGRTLCKNVDEHFNSGLSYRFSILSTVQAGIIWTLWPQIDSSVWTSLNIIHTASGPTSAQFLAQFRLLRLKTTSAALVYLKHNNVIGRAGASPPSRATGAQFLYIYDRPCDGTDTVISISPSQVTSCACAQSLSPCFVDLKEYLHVTMLRQQSLDRGKRGALSEASTTSCQRASRSGECQGKRKAPVYQYNPFWM